MNCDICFLFEKMSERRQRWGVIEQPLVAMTAQEYLFSISKINNKVTHIKEKNNYKRFEKLMLSRKGMMLCKLKTIAERSIKMI